MAFIPKLNKLQAVKSKGRLHVELLQAFVEHRDSTSIKESIALLQGLRKTRDEISVAASRGNRQLLQTWANDCIKHEGFTILREKLLTEEILKDLGNVDLSRTYNLLRRMNLSHEAENVWPFVLSRLKDNKVVNTSELLGIWSIAPAECLTDVETLLSKALGATEPKTWQLLSVISRAPDRPTSGAVLTGVKLLDKRLIDLSSDDLVLIVSQLGSRLDGSISIPSKMQALKTKAKAEIVARDGMLGSVQLCNLLGSIEGPEDELWSMVKKQLFMKNDLSPVQILEVSQCIKRIGGSEVEPALFASIMKPLQKQLNNTKAEPGLVATVARNLDAIVTDFYTCQALLNAAVRLRQDLYPAVLWRLFVRTNEVELVRHHPNLQVRMQRIGEILEKHSFTQHRMTLTELLGVAKAMRGNGVMLRNCSAEMTKQFLEVLQKVEEHDSPMDVASSASSAASGNIDKMDATSDTNWLGKVQELIVSFWVQLQLLSMEQQTLTSAMESFCAADGVCRMEVKPLAQSVLELEGVEGSNAESFLAGLTGHLIAQFNGLSQHELMQLAGKAKSDILRRAIATEASRRLTRTRVLKSGQDFDDVVFLLLQWINWSQATTENKQCEMPLVLPGLMHRTMNLLADSLPTMLQKEPAVGNQRLTQTMVAFSAFTPSEEVPIGSLGHSLNQQIGMALPWKPANATDIAFSYSALHGGLLPFDMAVRLWRLIGSALNNVNTDSDGLPNLHVAKLWAFGLAVRHLSTCTVFATLRLAPEAATIESLFNNLERKPTARFDLAQEDAIVPTLAWLRTALPQAVPTEICEERFTVPGTPYVVDFALQKQRTFLIVPRQAHRAPDQRRLSGPGLLMERTLEAMGWRTQWIWPEEWSTNSATLGKDENSEDLIRALRQVVGIDTPETPGADLQNGVHGFVPEATVQI